MVHLLWIAGTSLVVFALVLLAIEISDGRVERLIWVCLAYAAALFALDVIVQRRADLRPLSALLLLGIGAATSVAAGAFIELHFGLREVGEDWNSPRFEDPALLTGIYIPSLPLLLACAVLIYKRGFLPAWIGVLTIAGLWIADVYFGTTLHERFQDYWIFLWMSVTCFGLAWYFDLRSEANHGFWINKMGLIAFLIFSLVASIDRLGLDDELLVLLPTGLGLILFSLYVRRAAGVTAGALNVAIYIGDWVFEWDNLYVATGIIALIGIASIYLGVRAHLIEDRLDALLPDALRKLRPEARNDPISFGF
ncbi:MAG: hypothetical protein AAF678_13340 [Pseudomonadota bacterium]